MNSTREEIRIDFQNKSKNLSDSEKINELAYSAAFEEKCIDEEISIILTNSLTAKARKLLLPLPSGKKYWDECEYIYPRKKVLNNNGIDKVRKAIRNEYKNTLAYIAYLLAFIAAITGLIAVIKG
ncbi:MAG: hypothetical protein GWP19_13750 [Planctomycetia bacterium]|nr:hypothetical protein [Planctomycetia bacterium]